MRFAQDPTGNINVIRAYGAGEFRVNDDVFRGALIVGPATVQAETELRHVDELTNAHAERVLTLQPELVLLGTGDRQVFPDASFGIRFLRQGVGFEVMGTGAACRTFNVLAAEQRRVVALLLPVEASADSASG